MNYFTDPVTYRKAHSYIYPRWSAHNPSAILCMAGFAMACGLIGAGLSHMQVPGAIVVWHSSIAATTGCLYSFVKGSYQTFLDYGWDIYY